MQHEDERMSRAVIKSTILCKDTGLSTENAFLMTCAVLKSMGKSPRDGGFQAIPTVGEEAVEATEL